MSLNQNQTGTILSRAKLLGNYSPPCVISYHLPDVREQPVTKILSRLNRQLGRKIIDGAHENAVTFHAAEIHANQRRFKKYI